MLGSRKHTSEGASEATMDKTKTRSFLGEVWVHPLPWFKVPA